MPSDENPFYKGNALEINMLPRLDDARNKECQPYQCTCSVFSTHDKPLMTSQRTFGIIADMERVLNMKAKTQGKNTDLFGSQNFHVSFDPNNSVFTGGGGSVLANDLFIGRADPEQFNIAVNDSQHALFTKEGFAQEVYLPDELKP